MKLKRKRRIQLCCIPQGRTILSSEKPLSLLVEDEALLALPLETELADAGFEVVLASSGKDAISQIELDAVRFSGLITDIRLPHVDGWTLPSAPGSWCPQSRLSI